jgi:NADH-quinone oxidoreductase subunit G
MRRLAGDDPQVNEEWNCDKGRWAFRYAAAQDRLTSPLVRDADGNQVPTSWAEALSIAAAGLSRAQGAAGVLVGGRSTQEDAYAYAKFARLALRTNDIDFRARPHSAEEEAFLAAEVAGRGLGVTYSDLASASAVLLVGLEPEEESPILFLRLRKAVRSKGLAVHAVGPFAGRGLHKLSARLIATVPGGEAAVLDAIRTRDKSAGASADALHADGAVILVGERLASSPGALSAVSRLAAASGARVAWVPRRAGERGALEAGALPTLLPGGRPVAQAAARVDVSTAWGVDSLPDAPGRGAGDLLAAVHTADVRALVIGGVDPNDLPDPTAALAAIAAADFVVSLELRTSSVTERADVVFPVAPVVEKAGTFVDWEGRERPFTEVLRGTNALADTRVLHVLAAEMDVDLGLPDVAAARAELAELGHWDGERAAAPDTATAAATRPGGGEAVLATWHLLLDAGRLQDDEPFLAATARRPVARLSAETASDLGVEDGADVTVSTDAGSITLPLAVTDMPARVVWLPTNSAGSTVRATLRADAGAVVRLTAGGVR